MELIDTDVLIDVQRGFGAAADWFATDPDVGVPGFVVMELVQDARNSDEVQKALALVDGLEVVWPSEEECQTALEQFSTLHLSHGLGLLDALIAATAAVMPRARLDSSVQSNRGVIRSLHAGRS